MAKSRNYLGKDVEMLTTCATIIDNAIANEEFLAQKRITWASPFFDNLRQAIDDAFNNFLGMDRAARLRLSTQALIQIQRSALLQLAEIKIQIEQDFKNDKPRRDEILRTLGYTELFKKTRNNDQEAVVQLLFQFKASLTPELKAEIANKGTNPDALDQIVLFADQLSQANITQEAIKSNRKVITGEAVAQFNTIYDKTIAIAKIARKFHKGNAVMQDKFSYRKIHKGLNFTLNPKPPTPEST